MTASTSGMSSPRAATSVATSSGTAPDLNPAIAAVRAPWLMSPWIAAHCAPRAEGTSHVSDVPHGPGQLGHSWESRRQRKDSC